MRKIVIKILNKLLSLDIWVNSKLGGNSGETISSRLGRMINKNGCFLCKFFCVIILLPLGLIINHSFEHCRDSIQKRYNND